ncbi:MAG: S1 RNA-binding domain-containing protein, partial [Spirochaetes bacterium]|nr:S1 RNA-binding domain-containing protein [Spirochaetota bacterium]
GAFVKIIDGVEGLLHISDMSWTKNVKNPKELLQSGQQVEVKIISIDIEKKKISLSLKHLLENPWDTVEEKFPIDKIVKGKIKTITSFGVFVELEEGMDALLHRDDLSWIERIEDVPAYFKDKENSEIEVKIIQLDKENKKIKVGLKQLSDDPWQEVKDKYKKFDAVECEITNIDPEMGLQVKLTEKYYTYISLNQIEFGKIEEIKETLSKNFQVGDKVKAVILNMDYKKRDVDLSIKELLKIEERKKIKEYLHDTSEDDKFTLEDMMKSKSDE